MRNKLSEIRLRRQELQIAHVVALGVFLIFGSIRPAAQAAESGRAGQEAAGLRPFTIRDVKPPFTFTITTTTPDGRPQPGVTIRCLHPRSERGRALVDTTAKADESGAARFIVRDANLVTDRYIWFNVMDAEFAGGGSVGISPLDREFTWTFKTLPLQKRIVQIVDPQGKGVAGARVWLRCPPVFPDTSDIRSDNDGRMILKCPPGRLTAAALASGFASTVHYEVELPADRPYVIQLDQGHQIQGRILDGEGRPVEGLLVQARKEEPFHYLEEFIPKARSGTDGRFTLGNVSPGDWKISAQSEDPNRPLFVAPVTYAVGAGAAQNLALEAREGFRIKGRCISRYDTRPIGQGGRYSVEISVDPPLQALWEEQTREDGTFDIWGLPCHAAGSIYFMGVSGFHRIIKMVPAPPFFRVNERNIRFENVPPGTYEGIEVQFLLAGRVEGTVTDLAGDPMQDVEVVVKPPGYIYRTNEKGQFAGATTTLIVHKRQEQSNRSKAPRSQRGEPMPPMEEILHVSEPFALHEGQIAEKHLIVAPTTYRDVPSVQPRPPAPLASLDIEGKPKTLAGKKVLVCFFDMNQRPSRRLVQDLAARVKLLEQNNLPVLLIQASEADKGAVQQWLRAAGVPFVAGTTAATMPTLQQDWTVRALPWLVLLDEGHTIRAAGFDLQQLDESLAGKSLDRLPLVLDWRTKFEMVYRLAEGQILKRIVPPFIPEREEFYTKEHEHQASLISRPPDRFVFHWDAALKNWGLSFGDRGSLGSTLSLVLRLDSYEYEGAEDLLKLELPGDWIVRDEAPVEAKLQALEQLLAGEVGRNIRFVRRPAEQEVIVATGRLELHPLPKPFRSNSVTMYSDEADHDSGGGGGTARSVDEFLKAVGDRVGLAVVNQTEPAEPAVILYNHYRSSYLTRITDPAEKARKLKVLLENLSTQTSLRFNVERRVVEKWFVTEIR